MTTYDLVRVVAAMRQILATHGHEQKAAWLAERQRTLETGGSADATQEALKELRSIVPGMGGLLDLPLEASSKAAEVVARSALDDLAERLFELTRSESGP